MKLCIQLCLSIAALLANDSFAQTILDNTTWRGVDNDRDVQVTFLPNGTARYTNHNGAQFVTYENARWTLNGNDLYWELNNKFVEKNAKLLGSKITGTAFNKAGKTWSFEYKKIDLATASSFEQVARRFDNDLKKSIGNDNLNKTTIDNNFKQSLSSIQPNWKGIGMSSFIGQGDAERNLDVSIYIDTAVKASTKKTFAGRLLLGGASGGFYLIMDKSPLNYTSSIVTEVSVDCRNQQVTQLKAIGYSASMAEGRTLGVFNADIFNLISLKVTQQQPISDVKKYIPLVYCQQALKEEKKEEAEEARQKYLESPEGKKYLAEEAAKEKKAEEERLKSEAAEKLKSDKKNAEEKAKKEKIRQQCEKMNAWASDSREIISGSLNISMNSISLVRFEMWKNCLAIIDTPKGPNKCQVMDIIEDKKTGTYFADMGMRPYRAPICGGLAF